MSVIKKNLGRFSTSFLTSKNINNRHFKFSVIFSGEKNSNKFGFLFGKTDNFNDLKQKKFGLFNLAKSASNIIANKKEEKKKFIINQQSKNKYKLLFKYIRTSFVNKYTDIYYKFKGEYSQYYQNKYLLYGYYRIKDILANKKCSLVVHLNECKIYDNKKEFLIRLYKTEEAHIIMIYLLNFIYKYDKLSYAKSKEITDIEAKEEIIKTFYYLTSKQYIYEHLFDNDYFKENPNLLKYVNLANQKASYDYSFLDISKKNFSSQENEDIVNALKIINEYINNRNFIEEKLIKNYPIEKVPNILPTYVVLGRKINIILNKFNNKRKLEKLEIHEETKVLIDKYKKEYSQKEDQKQKSSLLKGNLFNIQENFEEDITGKSKTNLDKSKRKTNLNIKKILTESLDNISDLSNKKDSLSELSEQTKENNNNNLNKVHLNHFYSDLHMNPGYNRDHETNEIENFLKKLAHNTKKTYISSPISYNNKKEEKQNKNSLILNNKNSNDKFKMNYLKIIKKHNEENFGELPSRRSISSSIFNFRNSFSNTHSRNLNNRFFENNIMKSPQLDNNISSSIFNNINNIYPKINNSFNINNKLNNLNNQKINGYKTYIKYDKINATNIFKETNTFIKESMYNKKKMTLKRNIILKKFSNPLSNSIKNNNSRYFFFRLYSSKTNLSLSPNNNLKTKRLFKKTDFEKIVFKMNKRLKMNKKKESQLYTQKQILKNGEIYNYIFN